MIDQMTPLSFHIAGLEFQVSGVPSLAALRLPAQFTDFYTPADLPVARTDIHLQAGDPRDLPVGELLFDPHSIWRVYRHPTDPTGWAVRVGYPQGDNDETAEVQATLYATADWSSVTLIEPMVAGEQAHSLLGVGVGELLLRARLLFADGLVFHSTGLNDNGKGLMFVGHSGAGKSTQTLLWSQEPGVVAMNDDRIAVRLTGDGPMAYGAPWGGSADIARNLKAPLHGIVVLEQAPDNILTPLTPANAVALLMPRLFLPYWDGGMMTRAITLLSRILDTVPVYRLQCRPEREVIDLVRAAL